MTIQSERKKTFAGGADIAFYVGDPCRVADPACLAALEAARIDIFSSVKQRTEEVEFGLGG